MADSKLKKEIERGSYKNCIRIKGAREHNLKGIDEKRRLQAVYKD